MIGQEKYTNLVLATEHFMRLTDKPFAERERLILESQASRDEKNKGFKSSGRPSIDIPDEEVFKKSYYLKNFTELSRDYGVSSSTIARWADYYGLRKRRQRDAPCNRPSRIPLPEENEFRERYFKYTFTELGEHYGVGRTTVTRWASHFGIDKKK